MGIIVTAVYVVACVLLFALAIIVHEFGHFIVALKLGLRVEAFSIGFGPVLWKFVRNGVEYRLSAIPLGGYVSIPDVDPEGTKALEGETVNGERGTGNGVPAEALSKAGERVEIPAWKEIAVAVAGPGMNIVLAVALAFLLAAIPGAKFGQIPAEIGGVFPDSPAEKAGIKPGDMVVSVGGRPVSTWSEMQTEVQISGGKTVEFVCVRDGETLPPIPVTPEKDDITGAYFIKAYSTTNHANAAAWMPSRSPVKQLLWDASSIFRVLKGLVTPKEAKATAGALGGPVMIAEGIYRSMRRSPWDGLGFLRFLNVNLAVLNLLPIPVLDGGLIMFALFALVFRRRVPACVVKYVSLFFMVVLMGLMGILVLKDSWRSWKIHTQPAVSTEGAETVPADNAKDARD